MTDKATALLIYRSILRLHARHLPDDMRAIGDAYVRSEFKLHKNVTNDQQKSQFIQGWKSYLATMKQSVEAQERLKSRNLVVDQKEESNSDELQKFGSHMPPELTLSDDQRNNLQKLKQEAYNLSNKS